MTPFDISAQELSEWRTANKKFQLIDVREVHEHKAGALSGDVHIPMGEFLARLNELEPDTEIVVYCRSGSRSAQVVNHMRQHGYPNMRNLAGGLVEWMRTIGKL